jgi:hypothetical protein
VGRSSADCLAVSRVVRVDAYAHLNCNDKKMEESVGAKGLRKDQHRNEEHRTTEIYREDDDSQIF